ncbi:hypothetical protein LEN26_004191 [Aphanomyces euteiches]|nr:hypothetical protein AeMF1_015555 [Aphanomyces euteiches]KAH9149749.1 hypothetical protein LEN26_004191 [Aphanomyces euteiches]KAH9194592.1 hypothetical protein AeNC1_003427 [Aphanomyces euteiches]
MEWFGAASSSSATTVDITKPAFLTKLEDMDVDYFNSHCSPLNDVIPCLERVVLPTILPLASSQPCCASFFDTISTASGESPLDLISHGLRNVADVLCSTQSPGFHGHSSQPCGYTFLSSVLATADRNLQLLVLDILNSLQIPNDQGVLVARGASFTTTLNQTTSLFAAPFVPDTCVQPVDTLFTWIRHFPVFQAPVMGLPLFSLFEDGQCVPGGQLLSAFAQAWPDALSVDVLDMLERIITDSATCFHLANGYSTATSFTTKLSLFSINF